MVLLLKLYGMQHMLTDGLSGTSVELNMRGNVPLPRVVIIIVSHSFIFASTVDPCSFYAPLMAVWNSYIPNILLLLLLLPQNI